jgi:hypothetical protein
VPWGAELEQRRNVGAIDRGIRIAVGLGLIAWALSGAFTRGEAILIYIVAAILLTTGITGICFAYAVIGIDTCKPARERRSG